MRRFIQTTGTPPPLHAAVLHNFFDGAYLLTTCKICDANEKDAQGLTALHLAAWLGNWHMILLLLHNGVTPDAVDPYGRTFFHYLASRGFYSAVRSLLVGESSLLSTEMKTRLVATRDSDGHSPLDIALIPPAQMRIVSEINSFMKVVGMNPPPLEYDFKNDRYGSYNFEEEEQCVPQYPPSTEAGVVVEQVQSVTDVVRRDRSDLDHWYVAGTCTQGTSRNVKPTGNKPKIWNTVITHNWRSLSDTDFRRYFYYTQRPLKLVGNFTSIMKVWAHLDRKEFMNRYGTYRLNTKDRFGRCEEADLEFTESPCSITLAEYFDTSRNYGSSDASHEDTCVRSDGLSCDALTAHELVGSIALSSEEIIQDMMFPQKFFSLCDLPNTLRGSMRLQVMSSNSAVTRFHSESAMWNVLLVGVARHWYLLSPGVALNISSTPNHRYNANGDMSDWIENIFPLLRKNRLAVEVVQRTGDVIFIPYSWSFVTSGEGDLVDFSHNFCVLPENPSVFGQVPVGVRMYGNLATPQ